MKRSFSLCTGEAGTLAAGWPGSLSQQEQGKLHGPVLDQEGGVVNSSIVNDKLFHYFLQSTVAAHPFEEQMGGWSSSRLSHSFF